MKLFENNIRIHECKSKNKSILYTKLIIQYSSEYDYDIRYNFSSNILQVLKDLGLGL